jgi:hypothetical protein
MAHAASAGHPGLDALAVVFGCLCATTLGALLFPWRAHRHYLRWTRRAPTVGLIGFLLLNACAGLIGWGFGRATGWRPENTLLRGFLWASFGLTVLRAQLDKLPKPDFAGDAASAIGTAGSLIVGLVDDAVETVALARLRELDDGPLAQYVLELFEGGVDGDRDMSAPEKKDFLTKIMQAADYLDGEGNADKMQARAFLRTSGSKWAVKYAFDPPGLVP